MKIDKDTRLFFSISTNPGNFGATLYNRAFEELEINAIYKPLKLDDIFGIYVNSLRSSIKPEGISVSMPYKRDAYKYVLGAGGEVPVWVKNINTVVFRNKNLNDPLLNGARCYGENTDIAGFEQSCYYFLLNSKNAVVYGDGALAESIRFVLNKYNIPFVTVKRDGKWFPEADWLINASPVGMKHIVDTVFTEEVVNKYENVFDCVVSAEGITNLIELSVRLDKYCVNGVDMCISQLCEQFKIYTKQEAPRDLFEQVLQENGYVVRV